MAVSRQIEGYKLAVTMKNDMDESMGTQTISGCNPEATNENFHTAGQAIMALTGAMSGEIKKTATYFLIQE